MTHSVTLIPARPDKVEKKVGIYCRVSSNKLDQLNSLTEQISGLTRLVSMNRLWRLRDTFIDIGSAKGDSPRREFDRMLAETESHNIEKTLPTLIQSNDTTKKTKSPLAA